VVVGDRTGDASTADSSHRQDDQATGLKTAGLSLEGSGEAGHLFVPFDERGPLGGHRYMARTGLRAKVTADHMNRGGQVSPFCLPAASSSQRDTAHRHEAARAFARGRHDTVRRMMADAGLHAAPGAGVPGPLPAAGPPHSPDPSDPSAAPAPMQRASPAADKHRDWIVAAVARGLALFIGGFTLVGVYASWRHETLDFNIWWVALPLGGWIAHVGLLALLGVALVAYAVAPRMRVWRRWTTLVVCAFFTVVTAWNGADFYRSWRAGDLRPGLPVPLSFVICALLVFVAWAALRPPAPRRRRLAAAVVLIATAAACVLLFPVAQVFFFGKTDYRRPAEIVVVFGAQVHEDGRASTSLRDRMDTAIGLYKDGLVKKVLVSGGVGDSGFNEALIMRDMAVEAGVRKRDVIVDSAGVNTEATVRDSRPFFEGAERPTALAVSQFYHLPRIKLAYQGEGATVFTVPAGTSSPIPQTPRFVVREIPAFWAYYLKAVLR
jgi:vancomycin permeability regulator SanA